MPRLGPYLLYNYLYKSDRTGIETPYKYWPFTGFYSLGKNREIIGTTSPAISGIFSEQLGGDANVYRPRSSSHSP